MFKKNLRWAVLTILVLFVIIQLVPYGRAHSNLQVRLEPQWDSPQTRELARRACYDCHSNETIWPWYSNVAPMSWLVRNDVEEGRHELNFSEWNRDSGEADDALETIEEGSMPPRQYTIIHRDARLTDDEAQTLIDALALMDARD